MLRVDPGVSHHRLPKLVRVDPGMSHLHLKLVPN